MPELRRDPVVGRWVIVDTERVRRPHDFREARPPRRGGPCLLCGGHEVETPPAVLTLGGDATGGWRVRVVPNKFPSLRVEGDLERRGHGLYDLMNGVGAHELIVESPKHDDVLASLPLEIVENVIGAWRERIRDLKRDPRFRAAVVVKTHGLDRGQMHEHPHSQLLATPITPQRLSDELHHARAYHDYRERCLFCDIMHQETEEQRRLVLETEHLMAFAPFAARFPFETWILPRRHLGAFENADPIEHADLARALRGVLRRMRTLLGDPPYSVLLHTAPFADADSPFFHWHVEVIPRLAATAGFEWESGLHTNPVPPEDAARFLRDAPE